MGRVVGCRDVALNVCVRRPPLSTATSNPPRCSGCGPRKHAAATCPIPAGVPGPTHRDQLRPAVSGAVQSSSIAPLTITLLLIAPPLSRPPVAHVSLRALLRRRRPSVELIHRRVGWPSRVAESGPGVPTVEHETICRLFRGSGSRGLGVGSTDIAGDGGTARVRKSGSRASPGRCGQPLHPPPLISPICVRLPVPR